jgi:tripartite-type tricarboxylate transporter receptor subunit TctC
MKTRRFLLTALCAVTLLGGGHATAQQKPIRLIVPYAAGGPIDVTARALAEQIGRAHV